MRVLLDEDVHVKVADWLTQTGHDVIRVPLDKLVSALTHLLKELSDTPLAGKLVVLEETEYHLFA